MRSPHTQAPIWDLPTHKFHVRDPQMRSSYKQLPREISPTQIHTGKTKEGSRTHTDPSSAITLPSGSCVGEEDGCDVEDEVSVAPSNFCFFLARVSANTCSIVRWSRLFVLGTETQKSKTHYAHFD